MVVPRLNVNPENKKIPVILDTDIGGDIDDTWALAMMLKSPELDVRLVVTDTGNTTYRAKIAAKMLEIAERTDIPIGIGIHLSDKTGPQAPWVEGYDLSSYPGIVYQDGVNALISTITASKKPITLICIGPVTNIPEALRRESNIAGNARFVGMCGCIRKSPKGYGRGGGGVVPEYNVAAHPNAYQRVFAEPWNITITPLDTCGFVRLKGEKYRAVRECKDPLVQAMIENYRIWSKNLNRLEESEVQSSTLFDPVAVYLAFSEELFVMEKLGIRVTDEGYTTIDPNAKITNCATEWKDLAAFEDLLVKRLTDRQIQ
jgi:inosine-uridine nucleoside N-ribohydrolase